MPAAPHRTRRRTSDELSEVKPDPCRGGHWPGRDCPPRLALNRDQEVSTSDRPPRRPAGSECVRPTRRPPLSWSAFVGGPSVHSNRKRPQPVNGHRGTLLLSLPGGRAVRGFTSRAAAGRALGALSSFGPCPVSWPGQGHPPTLQWAHWCWPPQPLSLSPLLHPHFSLGTICLPMSAVRRSSSTLQGTGMARQLRSFRRSQ